MTLFTYWDLFLSGAGVTLKLVSLSLVFGMLIGVAVGTLRRSPVRPLKYAAATFIGLFRSIPILIQLFLVFYALPYAFGINIPQFAAATLSLSLYCGSYMAEVVRSALDGVPAGQMTAARALGFGSVRAALFVVWPQAFRLGLPGIVGVFVMTLKDSSLASVIGYTELTGAGIVAYQSTPASSGFSVFIGIGALYFAMAWSVSFAGRLIEDKLSFPGMPSTRFRAESVMS